MQIDDNENLKAFINKNSLTWPQICQLPHTKGKSEIGELYQVDALPQMLLIDKNGEILKTDFPTDDNIYLSIKKIIGLANQS